ncbi:hypothetical protein DERP_009128 [Dermatophagoides pteronyssinus]|uniref:Uncharacterized protein n=1 Tax=Dermatophagoides pteronyssinus TaxID=6956 RepID=A0ABQ8JQN2_DERPT|nr:hypothetical protein DERP_009128 [Dermatophagoides pteronyssinus]
MDIITICSTIHLLRPYGFVHLIPIGCDSSNGRYCGSPYTVAEDENINFLTPYFSIAVNSVIDPPTLLR